MYYCNISEHCAKKWILKQSLERNYDIKMLYREIKCTKKTFFYFLFLKNFSIGFMPLITNVIFGL